MYECEEPRELGAKECEEARYVVPYTICSTLSYFLEPVLIAFPVFISYYHFLFHISSINQQEYANRL